VVIDSPPSLAATDAAILATLADGTILVVDSGGTKSGVVVRARETLDRVEARVLGVVLNKVPQNLAHPYYEYYYDGLPPVDRAGPRPQESQARTADTMTSI